MFANPPICIYLLFIWSVGTIDTVGALLLTPSQPNARVHYTCRCAISNGELSFESSYKNNNHSPLEEQLQRKTIQQQQEKNKYQTSFAGAAFWNTALIRKAVDVLGNFGRFTLQEIKQLTPIQTILVAATFFIGYRLGRIQPFWKRITSVLDIPSGYFGPTAPILKGRAASITDGDTIRFLHVPTWFHPLSINKSKKEKLSTTCLPIRLCTFDTPETAKFGKPGQPFGDDAKAYLTQLLENKVVKLRLLSKDQYGRAVAQVYTGRWPARKFVDEQMLKAGLGEVYQGMGAVYGPLGMGLYLDIEKQAKKEKIGIWSQENRESAADFKKRTK
mmetsp:Transcript_44759/g.50187  ORF Transcript_44759/g.50187 Transcript_44759/m.50187 type:complete len:331 (-) Transcript_44759:430-1422(-)